MQKIKNVSLLIPCFNEEKNVVACYLELKKIATSYSKYRFEFIFVDNGSEDKTWNLIEKIAHQDTAAIGIRLSRNFGPEASIQAGCDQAHGEAAIIYECDMQDPPHVIHQFIKKWQGGYDLVIGIRTKIEDNFLMTFLRKTFYQIVKLISNIDIPINAGTYALITRRVLNAINTLPEKYRFHRGLRAWVGFRTAYITYERRKRAHGQSSYNYWRYIQHAERSFFGFSYLPLDIIVYCGLFLVSLSFLFLTLYLIIYLGLLKNPLNVYITIIALIVFFGGVELLAISLVGKYIQVIVEESKARPMYIIDQKTRNKT